MASYYYLLSSLPTLDPHGDVPFSYEAFLKLCQGNVSEANYAILENLTPESSEGPLLREWAVIYRNLTKELNSQRSIRLGKAYPSDFDKDPIAASVASSAISADNPLDAEQQLLAYEFSQLDDLIGLHIFDDYALFGYALKLMLLERAKGFEHDKGKQEFTRLFEKVQEQILDI